MIDFFKIILSLKGYKLKKANKELEKIHALNRTEFLIWQKEKCWAVVNYHFKHNQFYKELLGNTLPTKWEDIPEMTKAGYQKPLSQLIADEYKIEGLYVANTSGSTGNPFFFAKDKFAHAMTWAVIFYYYSKFGIKNNDLQARFFGIPLSGKSKYVEMIKDYTMNRIRFPVFNLGDQSLEAYLGKFKKNKIKYIYGYTNSIRHFASFIINKSIVLKDVCNSLIAVIVTAEMCTPQDKEIITTAFGIPVYIEYGASETGIIAYDGLTPELKVCEETLYLETNEKNEILITTFYNFGFPLIRYKIGDLATLEKNVNGTFIKSLIGRSDDLIKLPNGKEAAGLTFYYCTRAILEKSSAIKEIYITQKTISKFLINYVSETDLSEQDKKIIQSNIDKMLQPNLELIYERTTEIRRKKNGKFQVFTSEIK